MTPNCSAVLCLGEKSENVARYIDHVVREVGVIAHSCGVKEPRELTRAHALIVCDDGRPRPMTHFFPDV